MTLILLCLSSLRPLQNNLANLSADFSAIKELDSLSNEIVELQKYVFVLILI